MKEKDQVLLAQKDAATRERFITTSMDFICRCASKTVGRFMDCHAGQFGNVPAYILIPQLSSEQKGLIDIKTLPT